MNSKLAVENWPIRLDRKLIGPVLNATKEWCTSRADHSTDDLIKGMFCCRDLFLSRGMAVGKFNQRKGNNWHRFSSHFLEWKLHIFSLQSCSLSGSYIAWAFFRSPHWMNTTHCWNRYLGNSALLHSVLIFDHHFNLIVVFTVSILFFVI